MNECWPQTQRHQIRLKVSKKQQSQQVQKRDTFLLRPYQCHGGEWILLWEEINYIQCYGEKQSTLNSHLYSRLGPSLLCLWFPKEQHF